MRVLSTLIAVNTALLVAVLAMLYEHNRWSKSVVFRRDVEQSIRDPLVTERLVARMQDQVAALNFSLGKTSEPSDIILGALDTYDVGSSFSDTSGKVEVACSNLNNTAIVVVLGQSNAANHGIGRYVAGQNVANFNLFDGRCYHAADPLLGASGNGGNFATRLGDLLVVSGLYRQVVIAPISIAGSLIQQWADEGSLNRRILALIRRMHDAGLSPTHILWHQGEGNVTTEDVGGRQYRKLLLEVVRVFRRYSVNAPFYVAQATLCGNRREGDENIRAGQRAAINHLLSILPGPDTDKIGLEFRPDTCHMGPEGLQVHAQMWFDSLVGGKIGSGLSRAH